MTLLLVVLAVALLAIAAYAHQRIPRHTAGSRRIWLLRVALLVTGVVFGYASARRVVDPFQVALAFLVGFGVVHVPAAIILFIKQSRGAAKS
jgi:hypothetical protein